MENSFINTDMLTEKEQMYLQHDEGLITPLSIVLRFIGGFFLLILSAFVSPSAEGKMPFSNFFMNTKKRMKFTKYRKAVMKKLDGDNSDKNRKILDRINTEPFALNDGDTAETEEDNIKKIYEDYLRENNKNDQSI